MQSRTQWLLVLLPTCLPTYGAVGSLMCNIISVHFRFPFSLSLPVSATKFLQQRNTLVPFLLNLIHPYIPPNYAHPPPPPSPPPNLDPLHLLPPLLQLPNRAANRTPPHRPPLQPR